MCRKNIDIRLNAGSVGRLSSFWGELVISIVLGAVCWRHTSPHPRSVTFWHLDSLAMVSQCRPKIAKILLGSALQRLHRYRIRPLPASPSRWIVLWSIVLLRRPHERVRILVLGTRPTTCPKWKNQQRCRAISVSTRSAASAFVECMTPTTPTAARSRCLRFGHSLPEERELKRLSHQSCLMLQHCIDAVGRHEFFNLTRNHNGYVLDTIDGGDLVAANFDMIEIPGKE